MKQLEAWGGVRTIFLTHRDDVADAAKWAAHFGARRVMHAADVSPPTRDVEHALRGGGPWALPHDGGPPRAAAPGDDVLILHVPGHTAGSCALLHKPSASLFTGDHLAFSAGLGRLTLFRRFNWHSLPAQLESAAALEHVDWLHLLPGHGRRITFESLTAKNAALRHALAAESDAQAAR